MCGERVDPQLQIPSIPTQPSSLTIYCKSSSAREGCRPGVCARPRGRVNNVQRTRGYERAERGRCTSGKAAVYGSIQGRGCAVRSRRVERGAEMVHGGVGCEEEESGDATGQRWGSASGVRADCTTECSRTEGVPAVSIKWGGVRGIGGECAMPLGNTSAHAAVAPCTAQRGDVLHWQQHEVCDAPERATLRREAGAAEAKVSMGARCKQATQTGEWAGRAKRGREQSANERKGGCGDWARTVRASVPCIEEYVNTGIDEARRVGAAVAWEGGPQRLRANRAVRARAMCMWGGEQRGPAHTLIPIGCACCVGDEQARRADWARREVAEYYVVVGTLSECTAQRERKRSAVGKGEGKHEGGGRGAGSTEGDVLVVGLSAARRK
ncbi:hypothetical protein B0H14DRAFT_2575452 [Mycena olivaceomarginata]|nr:hypothetical protein B0H14DRAFT_2575452 [Mycena olivaceomarginata]